MMNNRQKYKSLSLLLLASCIAFFSLVTLPALVLAEANLANPFSENSSVELNTQLYDTDYLDSLPGIVVIDEEDNESEIETTTELINNINELIDEVNDMLTQTNAPVHSGNGNESHNTSENEVQQETEQENVSNEPGPSSAEQQLVNEIKYGYKKTSEKLKKQQKPESVIAAMKFTKKHADKLGQLNPNNPWVSTSIDYLQRTVTNQIRYGTNQLKKKSADSSAGTAAWLSAWLIAAKNMNLVIDEQLLKHSQETLKKHEEQRANQPLLADNQRGGKVLRVPMRNQRKNAVGPAWSCGPTSLGMAMEYLGKKVSSVQLIKDCGTNRTGTGHAGMLRGAKKNGFAKAKWVYGESAAWVRKQIDAGKPVVINAPNHYMVCIGYNSRGHLIFNDPDGGKELVWSPSHFEANWVHGHAALILQ